MRNFLEEVKRTPDSEAFVLTDGMRAVEVSKTVHEVAETFGVEISVVLGLFGGSMEIYKSRKLPATVEPVNVSKVFPVKVGTIHFDQLQNYYETLEQYEKDKEEIAATVERMLS